VINSHVCRRVDLESSAIAEKVDQKNFLKILPPPLLVLFEEEEKKVRRII
jgi:hypothetical protein